MGCVKLEILDQQYKKHELGENQIIKSLASDFYDENARREIQYSYFGARYYNSDLSIYISPDKMSDKYPGINPYNYCAWNPLRLVDPTGMEWETPDDQKKANTLIQQATTSRDAKQAELDNLQSIAKPTNRQKDQMSNIGKEIDHMNEGITNLNEMGADKNTTYHFNAVKGNQGGVVKRSDGVFNIEHTNDAMAWHETVHIGDYRASSEGFAFDAKGYLSTNKSYYDRKGISGYNVAYQRELKAYGSQYSFDNNSLLFSNGTQCSSYGDVKFWVDFHKKTLIPMGF